MRGERLLDVGCDTGSFLTSAAEHVGIKPIGIDVSARAVREAAGNGVEAYHADIESAPDHLSDLRVITAIDLIEHVAEPGAFLRAVRARLERGGLLYVETPNIDSVVYALGCALSRLTRGNPRAAYERLFPAQHVQYFTAASLESLARISGFEVAHLGKRRLSFGALAASLPVRVGLSGVQLLDSLRGSPIILCALLRKS